LIFERLPGIRKNFKECEDAEKLFVSGKVARHGEKINGIDRRWVARPTERQTLKVKRTPISSASGDGAR
jgi:hypothetical protein